MNILLHTLFLLMIATAPASALDDPYRVDTLPVRSGGTLTVHTSGGSITVTGTSKNEARVEMTVRRNGNVLGSGETDLSDWNITIRKDGNDVIALAERKNSGSGNIWTGYNNLSISFTVYVPNTYSTKLSTRGGRIRVSDVSGMHDVKTSGGSLDFKNLTGETHGRTSGGSINASGINGVFDVATSGGSIRVEDIEGMVTMKTSGGSIRIENARGSFDASTSGGSINASFTEVTGPIDMSTSGGSVTVSVPRDLGFNLDARGNRVVADNVDFNGRSERDRMNGRVNGGGVPIRLRTSSGTVRLTTE